MAKPVPDTEQLDGLRRLDAVFDALGNVVFRCAANNRVTERDEKRYDELLAESQLLHGRLSRLLGIGVMQQFGVRWDVFQVVLSKPSISSLLSPYSTVAEWLESFKAAHSLVRQAIGRAEELQRQGRLGLSPEVVGRYQGLISVLERVRRAARACAKLALRPIHLTDPVLRRLENTPVIRLLIMVGGVAAGIVAILAVVAFVL